MSETEKPKLGMRAPLGIKRTVDVGQVKQSFSHGRTNTVVVEVKRKRLLGRPGEVEAAPVPVAAPVVAAPPPPPPPAPVQPRSTEPQLSRQEMQTKFLREAEEARLNMLEEARRRDDLAKKTSSDDERRRADDNRKAEEEAVEAAKLAAEEEARQAALDAERAANAPVEAAAAAAVDDDERPVRKFGAPAAPRRPEPARPARGRMGDDRRQSGKLTVTKALGDEDGVRARSMAALKRAREKD